VLLSEILDFGVIASKTTRRKQIVLIGGFKISMI
jgi:hypothetical protein